MRPPVIVWVRDITGEETTELPEHVAIFVNRVTYTEHTARIIYSVVPAHDTLIHTHVHDSSGFTHEHKHAHHPGVAE